MQHGGAGRGRSGGDLWRSWARAFPAVITGAALGLWLAGCQGLNPGGLDGAGPAADAAAGTEAGNGRDGLADGTGGPALSPSHDDAGPDAGAADVAGADTAGAADGDAAGPVAIEDGSFVTSFDVLVDPNGNDVGGKDAATDLPPPEPDASALTIVVAPHSAVRVVHEAVNFAATLIASDGTLRDVSHLVVWASSSPEVATVDADGVVTALSVGRTEISASLGALVGRESFVVVGPGFSGVAITPGAATIGLAGNTQAFVATMMFSNGDSLDITAAVTWISSRPDVAVISNLPGSWGMAIATGPGQTDISFEKFGFSAHATLTVPAPAP